MKGLSFMTMALDRRWLSKWIALLPLLVTIACGMVTETVTAADRPNIILIMADDMGYECVGVNGGQSYKTPNLDRMAAGGIRFTNCHSQPLCTPSRVQIMSGLYNHRNYVRFGVMDPGERTFGHVLKKAGYATAIFGKWQLGDDLEQPLKAGFDEYGLWHFDTTQGEGRGSRYWDPKIFVNGKQLANTEGKFGPDLFCDQLLDFAARKKKDGKPFFAYYPMVLPHGPLVSTPENRLTLKIARFQDKAAERQFLFAGMVAYIDTIVGRILAGLDKLEIREDTLVLFTCDNGAGQGVRSGFGDRIIAGGKGLTTDNGTHVPLIATWKGRIAKGRVCEDLIDFTDFLPTVAEVSGAGPPGVADGRSFLPQLRGEKGQPRDWIYCYYDSGHPRYSEVKRFARDRRWKLYDSGELYDVKADPDEKAPLSVSDLKQPTDLARVRVLEKALVEMRPRGDKSK